MIIKFKSSIKFNNIIQIYKAHVTELFLNFEAFKVNKGTSR